MCNSNCNDDLPESTAPAIVGRVAPDFRLYYTPEQTIALSNLRGRPVVLAFYVADWHPVCTDQMALYQELWPEFQRFKAALLAISVDNVWSHLAFARERKLTFPLLSDFESKGAVAQSYGIYRPQEGVNERALFVIDAEGVIRWRYVAPACVNPGVDGILTALERLAAEPTRLRVENKRIDCDEMKQRKDD